MKSHHKTLLGIGADLKAKYFLLQGNKISSSQEFGNLQDAKLFEAFSQSIKKHALLFDVLAFDKHPAYFSSRLALRLKAKRYLAVQHHYAHVASVLMRHHSNRPVIGIAFDGTGYGIDGAIWGGEFLVVNKGSFQRAAHFKYLKMPGAEQSIFEPWRMALSLLFDVLKDKALLLELGCLRNHSKQDIEKLVRMMHSNFNCPNTSSVGRIFDAVSSLLDICHVVNSEAEAAMALERAATQAHEAGAYSFDLNTKSKPYLIEYDTFVLGLLDDIKNKVPVAIMAKKFHGALADAALKMVKKISQEYRMKEVVISGGVFLNSLLFGILSKKLIEAGFNLFYNESQHGDNALGLGQLYAAQHLQ